MAVEEPSTKAARERNGLRVGRLCGPEEPSPGTGQPGPGPRAATDPAGHPLHGPVQSLSRQETNHGPKFTRSVKLINLNLSRL